MQFSVRLLFALAVTLFSGLSQTVTSGTIYVPADQSTIQAGIDAAIESDTVLVAPGTYTGDGNRDLDFHGVNLVLISENGPEVTILDCQGTGRGFYFHSGEDASAVVEGFTVRRGKIIASGSGAYLSNCSPTFKNCTFENNWVCASWYRIWECSGYNEWCRWVYYLNCSGSGGAVACSNASPTFTNCRFTGNIAPLGGAIYAGGSSSLRLYNTIINCNDAHSIVDEYMPPETYFLEPPPGEGGGVYCTANATMLLDHCTIVGNHTYSYYPEELWGVDRSGHAILSYGDVTLTNCVVAFNGVSSNPLQVGAIIGQNITLSRSNLFGNLGGDWVFDIENQANINGNFSLDPMFCNTATGDYHLNAFSPCSPGVQPNLELIGALGIGCGTVVCGDADASGGLDGADLQHMLDFYYGVSDTWPLPVSAGDMDCDGAITLADVVMLAGYISGYGPLPCCAPPPPPPEDMEVCLE